MRWIWTAIAALAFFQIIFIDLLTDLEKGRAGWWIGSRIIINILAGIVIAWAVWQSKIWDAPN
jgi:hypothetical protein